VIKVLIADDHAIIRTGLRALIKAESTMELIGEATDGRETIEIAERGQPDVLILDLSMPDLDGITVTKRIKARFPGMHILVLTVHEDDALVRAAIGAGASGYIVKRAAESELVAAIHRVLHGDLYIDPSMVRSLLSDSLHNPVPSREPSKKLTHREIEVLQLIAQGYTNRQIGVELYISVRTVESHRARLSAKLGLRSRVELVRYARDHKLIE
jgi:two-component system response regulator NreC